MRRPSTPILALAAAGGLLLDLSLAATVAVGDEQAEETPVPLALPLMAFLTGEVATSGEVGGLAATLEEDGGVYVLVLRNPAAEDRSVALRVDVQERSGLEIGRMGPMSRQVSNEGIVARVSAGATSRYTLAWRDPRAGQAQRDLPALSTATTGFDPFAYRTVDVVVSTEAPGPEGFPEVAVLRVSTDDAVAEGSP